MPAIGPVVEEKECPVCGKPGAWAWYPVKHRVNGDVIWHTKGAFGGKGKDGGIQLLASVVINGKRSNGYAAHEVKRHGFEWVKRYPYALQRVQDDLETAVNVSEYQVNRIDALSNRCKDNHRTLYDVLGSIDEAIDVEDLTQAQAQFVIRCLMGEFEPELVERKLV